MNDQNVTIGTQDNRNHSHGRVKIQNPNLANQSEDVLYHFALNTKKHDFKQMFGDVQFVCVGGSPRRMEYFANFIMKELHYTLPAGQALANISSATDRYALFKVGPVLAVSHGIGIASFSVMMHELIKLLHYAEATNVCCFRLGTSGGLGLEPGTVVITDQPVDGLFRPVMEQAVLGKLTTRPALLDQDLANEMLSIASGDDHFLTIKGKTMCTMDFYEGQARLDGAFCDFNDDDKMAFLQHCFDQGIRNIEMESLCFAAMCHGANLKGAVVCVTLLDRLQGDQVATPAKELHQWDERPALLVSRFIKNRLNLKD